MLSVISLQDDIENESDDDDFVEFLDLIELLSSDSDDDDDPDTLDDGSNFLFNFDEQKFKNFYRISPTTFQKLINLLKLRLMEQNEEFTAEKQILLSLRYYATGNLYNELTKLFKISQNKASKIINRVSMFLEEILRYYIAVPVNANEVKAIQMGFYEIGNIPNVIGAISTRHIILRAPSRRQINDEIEIYRNTNQQLTLIVQIVCDANYKILNIDASSPGSMTSQEVYDTSFLKDILDERESVILLGDSSYECRENFLTPIQQPLTQSERKYNYSQRKTHQTINTCFRMISTRFPLLEIGFNTSISRAITTILALGVLHNFALLCNDTVPIS